jgi:putative spermidine/putrescine transport system substrate-binding protein
MHPDDGPRDRRLRTIELSGSPRHQAMREARVHRHVRTLARRRAPETLEEELATKHSMPRLLTVGAALMFIASACGGSGASPASSGGAAVDWTPDAALLASAKTEGALNVIALPRDWCNYGALLDTFKAKTGLTINSITPNAGSGDEVNAIKNNPNGGPTAPDVIDVGYSFGGSSKDAGLLQPYKVKTWDSIPADQKDPDGNWAVDYYGVLSFEVNTDIVKNVPQDWSDLLKSDYAHSVALAGDPLNSNQAIQSIEAAAVSDGAGGSLDNAQPGLQFFKKLVDAGNFVPTVAKQGSLVSGETPIVITWSYLALADRDKLKGTVNIQVVIPKSGRFGGNYVQAISKTAPHPNAAKLWEEYLYSDAGQLVWTGAYCYTSRYADLVARNVIPADLKAKLPDVTGAVFPSTKQLADSKTLISGSWASVTGVGPLKTPPPAP